jgi:type II secretory pathway pseudopilin PulG
MAVPEGPEVDTDKLRETIDEEIEKEGSTLLRTVALTTAILAALAAIASLKAGGTVNEALALKTESTRLQAEASDQWAYYQAKGLKATVTEVSRNTWIALDKTPPDDLAKNEERYVEDQKRSMEKAKEFEKQRDEKSTEADHLMHRHHFFAQSVAWLQVSIALGAVAALTRKQVVWAGSLVLGLAGAGIFAYAFVA